MSEQDWGFVGIILFMVLKFNSVETTLRQHIKMQREVWLRQGVDVPKLMEDVREPSFWDEWRDMTWSERAGYFFSNITAYALLILIIYLLKGCLSGNIQ